MVFIGIWKGFCECVCGRWPWWLLLNPFQSLQLLLPRLSLAGLPLPPWAGLLCPAQSVLDQPGTLCPETVVVAGNWLTHVLQGGSWTGAWKCHPTSERWDQHPDYESEGYLVRLQGTVDQSGAWDT